MSEFGQKLEEALRTRNVAQAEQLDTARANAADLYDRVSDVVVEVQAALTASEDAGDIGLTDITDQPERGAVRFDVETQRTPDAKVVDVITIQVLSNGSIEVTGLDSRAAAALAPAGTGTARAVPTGGEDAFIDALKDHLFRFLTA